MPNLLIKLLILAAIFVTGLFLGTRCTLDKGGVHSPSTTKTTIRTDTITIFRDREITKTKYIKQPTLVTVYKDRLVPQFQADSTPTLSVRDYSDTLEVVKGLSVNYKAQTTGTLDNITLGFSDKRPEKTQVVTTFVERETKTNIPTTGLYVGGFSSPNLSAVGLEATVVMPRLSFGAGYNFRSTEVQPLNKVQIHLGYNLFPVK